jgi:hypothetical protein
VQDPFSDLAERYDSSGGILRQVVRHELVDRARSPNIFRPPGTGCPVRTCLRYSSRDGGPDRGTPTGL